MVAIEVGVILTLCWLVPFVTSLQDFISNRPYLGSIASQTTQGCWNRCLSNVAPIVAVLFIIWGSGEPLRRFGLQLGNFWAGIWIIPFFLAHRAILWLSYYVWDYRIHNGSFVSALTYHGSHFGIDSTSHLIALICMVLTSAFAQELVYRGYLITRLTDLFGKSWVSIVGSTLIFGSLHLYEGWPAAITITLSGFLYALQYRQSGSLIPSTLVHTVWNVLSNLSRLGRLAG